jgi:formylglycine-generating enzyme required for sulfatase activity/serine/threonine protein kinase
MPAGRSLRRPEHLLPVLPTALPRFKPGDQPLAADWELVELLGKGGFGEVWKARHLTRSSQKPVALKFCLDPVAARSLRNEAALHDALDRVRQQGGVRGIVPLLETYLGADPPCLMYELIEGGDLAGLIQETHERGLLTPAFATQVVRRLASTVAFAHQHGLVHRDLKPSNVLVQRTEGNKFSLHVADFGIGGLAARQSLQAQWTRHTSRSQAMPTAVRGAYTPLYASPQQVQGERPDFRDDVHALGVIWYQLLTGDLLSIPPDWRDVVEERGLGEEHVRVLASCLASRVENRLPSASALAERLAALVNPRADAQNAAPSVEKGAGERDGRTVRITMKISALVGKLNQASLTALSKACGLSQSRTNDSVEVEHWLVGLLEIPDGDLPRILRHYAVDPNRVQRHLNKALDQVQTGSQRIPHLAPGVVDLMREAWTLAWVEYGATRIRSGHLLVALLADGTLSGRIRSASAELAKLPDHRLQAEVPPLVVGTAEDADERCGGEQETIVIGSGVEMHLAWIPPGTFLMGSPLEEEGREGYEGADGTQHRVTLTKGFHFGIHPVSRGQFARFVQATNYVTQAEREGGAYFWTGSEWKLDPRKNWRNPGFAQTDDHPVVCISWNDSVALCEWLTARAGKGRRFRLPSEAEWEYACRAGTTTPFYFGETISTAQANYNGNATYGKGAKGVYREQTTPVGSFPANARGLSDMHGNVWEWCQDWYGLLADKDIVHHQGANSGNLRVLRGGSWYHYPRSRLSRRCRRASAGST